MFIKLASSLICFCFINALAAQPYKSDSPDSIAIKKANEAFAMSFRNTDSALNLANEALLQSKILKNSVVEAHAYNSIGWAYMHKGNLDSSVIFIQKARELFSANKNEYDIIRVDINLAEVYTKQSQLAKAIKYLMQADSLSKKINNLRFQTDINRQLGIVYRESGDQKKSAEYFIQALEGFSKQKDKFRFVTTGISLSILYRQMKLLDSSLSLLFRCLQVAKENKNPPYSMAMINEHIGAAYYEKKNFTAALQYYTAAYKTFETINNQADLAYESFCVGKTLAKLNQHINAEKFLLQSYRINDSLKLVNYQLEASDELSSLYRDAGNWQQAYQYLQKVTELKDSIAVFQQLEEAKEIKEKFETEKKEQEIKLLRTEKQLAEAGSRKTRLLQYIFLLLLAASLIIGWLLFNRFKIKRRLQEQLLRNQIAGDLHDDIGSTLSSIDISSRIALLKKDDAAAVEEHLTRIRQHARKTMDSMSDIVWSINPHYDNFESLLSRMREFAAEVCEPQQIELTLNGTAEVEQLAFDTDHRKNIFLLFKEAVNNAVKYSGCTRLDINFLKEEHHSFVMRIQDNGNGFDEGLASKGNGLRNMHNRAAHLGGQLSIETARGKGTMIQLKCPV